MSTQKIIQGYQNYDSDNPLMHQPKVGDSLEFHRIAVLGKDESEFHDHPLRGDTLNTSMYNITRTMGGIGHQTDDFSFVLYIIVVPIVFALIVFFGTLGNSLVIFVILSKKKLQTVTNLLLLNLAIADISFLVVCGTFVALHYALTVWPFGDIMCRVVQFLLYVTCYVTVYTLIAVSAVRYLTVVYGPHAAFVKTKKNVLWLIFAIWFVFLLAKIPVLVVHGVSHNDKNNRTECIISGKQEAQNLFASFFVFAYALPLLLIVTLYLLILCHLKKKKQQALHHSPGEQERAKHVTKIVYFSCNCICCMLVTFAYPFTCGQLWRNTPNSRLLCDVNTVALFSFWKLFVEPDYIQHF